MRLVWNNAWIKEIEFSAEIVSAYENNLKEAAKGNYPIVLPAFNYKGKPVVRLEKF